MLEETIASHARRAELLLVVGRLLIVLTAIVSALTQNAAAGLGRQLSILTPHLLALSALVALGLLSARVRSRSLRAVLTGSVLLDAALLLAFFLPGILRPGPEHQGILRTLGIGIVPLAVVAAGCRFRLSLAVVGITSQLSVLVTLVAIDQARSGDQITYAFAHVASPATLFISGAVLALLIAHLTRQMVYAGAEVASRAKVAREKLRAYVSETVVSDVLDSSSVSFSLAGQQRYVAVMFCDLRDFTAYANSIKPARLVNELNDYFEAMVPVIQRHGGTVDKFIGDSIMAVFVRDDKAQPPGARALAAAAAMRLALDEHNRERGLAGLPPFRHGLGIHAGQAVVGNVGTAQRLQYTVIGDVVNVASRLEHATKRLATWLVCSREVWDDAGGDRSIAEGLPELVPMGPIGLRGIDGVVDVLAPPAAASTAERLRPAR